MMTKQEIIAKYGQNEQDTGSTEVQIALLTQRINHLTAHLKQHPHDNHTRRGLLKLVGKRQGLRKYLERTDLESYRKLNAELGLR